MESTKIQDNLLNVYDYVIVGGGASGCVLANRLSEDPNKTVLLLEAGGDDREVPNIRIPGECQKLTKSDVDWKFETVPNPNAFKGFKNQVNQLPRGKVLGGSGSINYMMFMRGTPHDYDIWKNMGCTGWGYSDVLPYFIKSESCLSSKLADSEYRGRNGPTLVSEVRLTPLSDVLIEAGKELGYPETDCNGPRPLGLMKVQVNTGDGVRQSSAEVYLRPVSHRNNLHISTQSYVTRVLIDNNIARGVEFALGFTKKLEIVRARREVILCGGAINTPQLLMISGIGPKQHLHSLNIDVVADLPVGDNFQDHVGCIGLEFETDKSLTYTAQEVNAQELKDLYDNIRAGPLSVATMVTTGLLRSEAQDPGNPNPDTMVNTLCSLMGSDVDDGNKSFKTVTDMKDEVWEAMFGGNKGKHGFSCVYLQCHPKSRGTIRLADKDPFTYPIIDHNCLTHPDDIKAAVAGVKIIVNLGQTKAMKDMGTRFTSRVLPGYKGTPFTDDYWEEYVRTMTFMTYHPCGTCRMGPIEDPSTVVDPMLRVKGVDRLRVVDASIMPEITSANLYAPCVMIAEKAADMIKGRKLSCNL